jgi:hypothetical protein
MTGAEQNKIVQEKSISDPKAEILKKTAKEYFDSAEDESKKGRHNSAVVLFFKSLVALTDLYILQQTGATPSSHAARFSITRAKFPDVYDLLDKDFPFYQDSYTRIMGQELAEVIKDDTKIMAGKAKIKLQ